MTKTKGIVRTLCAVALGVTLSLGMTGLGAPDAEAGGKAKVKVTPGGVKVHARGAKVKTGSVIHVGRPGGGPPPWAPAHGYRRLNGHGHWYLFDGHDLARAPRYDLSGCNSDVIGMLLGAAAGGYAGSHIGGGDGKLIAVGAGVLIGGLLGRELGEAMDQADPSCTAQAMETAPAYEKVTWQNPDSGAQYALMPSETYQDENGQFCREYQSSATVGDQVETVFGTACRQPDGVWKIVSG